jgi:hypothetical protein
MENLMKDLEICIYTFMYIHIPNVSFINKGQPTSNNKICEGFTCIFTSSADCCTILYILPSVRRKIWNLYISMSKSDLCCY